MSACEAVLERLAGVAILIGPGKILGGGRVDAVAALVLVGMLLAGATANRREVAIA